MSWKNSENMMVTSAHIVIILRKIWVCQYFSPSFFNGFLLGQFFFVFNTDHFWTCSIARGVSFEQNVICSRSSAKQTRGTPTFLQFPHFCFLFFVSRSDFVFFAFQFADVYIFFVFFLFEKVCISVSLFFRMSTYFFFFVFCLRKYIFPFHCFQFEDSRKHISDFYFKTFEVISIRLKKFSIDKSYFLFHCSEKL